MVKYVVDTLVQEDEGEDVLSLTKEQEGFLFPLLERVIYVLGQKLGNP